MWDDRDKELNLRTKMARLVAAKMSGIDPDKVTPNQDDYDTADALALIIDARNY